MRIDTDLGLLGGTPVLEPPAAPEPRAPAPPRAPASEPPFGPPAPLRERWLPIVAIAVPCLIAAALCAWQLSTRSLWLDEGASVSIASQHGDALWRALAHDGGNMLVYYLLLHALIGLFGDAETVIRMPSVIATVATVAITGMIGRRLFDRRVAFAAALLTAVSLPLVFWGQDARGYAPLVTFSAASFLAFVVLIEGDPARAPSRWWLGGYVLSTVLAGYMGFVGALVVPAQLLLLGVRPRRARALLGAMGVTALAWAPLLVLATARGSSQLFWVPRPNMASIGQTLRWLTSSGMPPNFHRSGTATLLMVLSIVVLVAALTLALRRIRAAWAARAFAGESFSTLVVLAWLVVPIALSLAESAAGQPILLFRNAIICLPAVALAMAWVLVRAPWGRSDWGITLGAVPLRTVLGWVAVAGLVLLRALQLAPSYGLSPEDWKAAERYVSAHTRPGDCIAFYPLDGRMPFDYYVRGGEAAAGRPVMSTGAKVPLPIDPPTPWAQNPPYVEDYSTPTNAQLTQIERSCPRMWFVASHEGQRHGPPVSRTNFIRYRVLGATLQIGYREHRRRNFGWAAQIEVELLSARQPAR